MKRKNIKIVIVIFIIFLGFLLGIYNYYIDFHKEQIEKDSIEVFFEDISKDETKNKSVLREKTNKTINYVAVLEIPKIGLKKGLVDPSSSLNDVSKNIEILKPVEMPDQKNGTFILASHSGSSNIAYFDRLEELKKDDSVYVYYKDMKYHYKISNYYDETKDGAITIKREKNKNVIVLTTCKKGSNNKQIIYIGNLIKKENIK